MSAISPFALYKGDTADIGVKYLPEIPIKITCNLQGISVILMRKIFVVSQFR